uniref:Putative DNA recombination protein n=1 Tax=viral metagenome TaxID=1070528 RepID=A0A6M3IQU8_9ZZZZ
MPIYESDTITRDNLLALRKYNRCKECGGRLDVFLDRDKHLAFLACADYLRTHHEGIEREASRYETQGMQALTIKARRDILNKEFGEKTTSALAKYQGVTTLTKEDATTIINTIWPKAKEASPAEVYKAVMICYQYGLNPLMRHLFLVPFWNDDEKHYDYTCIMGIGSNRLIAARKHKWTFLDDTPRKGTKAEETKHFGEVSTERIRAVAKMRDIGTGAEVTAWGEWPTTKKDKKGGVVANEPKGVDKGNSMINMACLHAERKGLDMLYPADMPPSDIPVADEHFINGQYEVLPDEPPEAEPAKAKQEPPIEKTEADSEKQDVNLTELTFKNAGEMKAACLKHFKLQGSQVDKESSMYDLSDPGQRHKAWLEISAVYGKAPEK